MGAMTGTTRWNEPFDAQTAFISTVGKLHRVLYKWSGGRMGGTLRGGPVLLLTTTGRRTGRERTRPLCYLEADNALVLVASAGGGARHPAWYLNLLARPRVGIQQAEKTRTMVARTAQGSERARLWELFARRYPVCAGYQRRAGREIPIVILRPAAPPDGRRADERGEGVWTCTK